MKKAIFTNDNNVEVVIPNEHRFSENYLLRDKHEVIFRKIITFLINERLIDISKNFIDLGCWIGDNAIPWSKNIKGKVYAIDPSEENLNYVKQIIELNNIENIVLIKEAISDTQKILSTNYDLTHCEFFEGANGKNTIKSTSLDILLETNIINNICFIHLDVEGMEHLVIKGAETLINYYNPIIAFEQHLSTDNYLNLCDILNKKNYKTFLIDEILPGCRTDCRNFLAFHDNIKTDLQKILNNFLKKDYLKEIKQC